MLLPHNLLLVSIRCLLNMTVRFLAIRTLHVERSRLIRACTADKRYKRRIHNGMSLLLLMILLEVGALSSFLDDTRCELGLIATFCLNLLELVVIVLALVVVYEGGPLNYMLLLITI